ncbi:hypothetical protein BH23GEM3_BH23GEM3_25840 [soil metagenome]|nr:hypothetical protein [Gemmatimonadota bacterium]
MTRNKWIGLAVAGLIVAFLIGFVPTYSRARTLDRELTETRHDLEIARLQGRLGAALAESHRSNYERARQLMAGFFTELQQSLGQVRDPTQQQELRAILQQRDEIITLLSRAEPESTQRLMLLYTRYFAAMDPAGQGAPAVTPSTPGTS